MARGSIATITVVAASVVALTQVPGADAFAKFALLLPNGDNIPDAPAIGHPDAAGLGGLNEFGEDWNKLGKSWTKAYCEADSDGDGFTNGQELGDPCCTWTPANAVGLITEGVSHPSDKTKTPANPKLQTKCATGGGAAGGASNSTGGATGMDEGPGTVAPAGDTMPEDDDEDDSDESATLVPKESGASTPHVVALVSVVSCVVALLL